MKRVLIMLFVVMISTGMREEKEFIQNDYDKIKGTWYLEDDFQSVWMFEDMRVVKQFYADEIMETGTIEIGKRIVGCDPNVGLNSRHTFLNITYSQRNSCYYLNGVTETTLSLSPIDGGEILIFKKQ